ncbi:MAG: PilT/PilU family type 4a pilus ATPase [Actinobacteria bacterium]|nr:PilT/PilU family type 4a pilus ATPase [Actinomycetota bacterium]
MANIQDYLRFTADQGGSDLHVKAGGPPYIRINGSLVKTDFQPLNPNDCERAAMDLMNEEQTRKFRDKGEIDFAYSAEGLGRFRVNVFRQRGSVGMACRLVLPGTPGFDALALPPVMRTLSSEQRGMLLVTGPTSSGKTTTTGAILDHINATRSCHILTIEDPIEILHPDRQAIVNQREIGHDTADFATALRSAMRQDPDVIFVGEIRDAETVKTALQAAETGHFVISTLHTTDVSETVNRIIDFFPPHQQKQIRVSLSASLKGIVSQRLLPRKDGQGRIPAVEVLVMNGRIHDLILNPEQTHMIHDIVAESSFYGMQTFDQALLSLFRSGLVTLDDAMAAASNAHDFQIALRREGLQPAS